MLHGRGADPRRHAVCSKRRARSPRTTRSSPVGCVPRGSSWWGAPIRPSSASCPPPSPSPTGRPATRGTPAAPRGGSSGGSAAAVASGMVPVGHAGGRGRVHPYPGQRVRAGGVEAVAGARPPRPGVGRRHGRARVRAGGDPHACATPRRCSTPWRARAPGDPYAAPTPPVPSPRRSAPTPAGSASGCSARRSARPSLTHPDCVAATEGAGALLESLGHDRGADPRGRPRRRRVRRGVPARVVGGGRPTTSTTTGRPSWAGPSPRTRSSPSHGRSPKRAGPPSASDFLDARQKLQAIVAPGGAVVRGRLRPPPHAHHRPTAPAARRVRLRLPTTRCTGCSAPPSSSRSPRRSTCRDNRRSRCPCTGTTTACPSACSWWRRTGARTSCCGWRRSWSRGGTVGASPSAGERLTAAHQ